MLKLLQEGKYIKDGFCNPVLYVVTSILGLNTFDTKRWKEMERFILNQVTQKVQRLILASIEY